MHTYNIKFIRSSASSNEILEKILSLLTEGDCCYISPHLFGRLIATADFATFTRIHWNATYDLFLSQKDSIFYKIESIVKEGIQYLAGRGERIFVFLHEEEIDYS